METKQRNNRFFDLQGISFWKRYYYRYVNKFLNFLVPDDTSMQVIRRDEVISSNTPLAPSESLEYVIASDILGFVEDVQKFFENASTYIKDDGRIVITQYSIFWEPILRLGTLLKLREHVPKQNWLSLTDLKNFASLSGLETVKSGTKMLLPIYIPLLSAFFNRVLANIFPFSKLGVFHYAVFRKKEIRLLGDNPSLSIIVPARNEAGTIEKIATELPNLGAFTEIIFIEGNSTDNTFDEIKRVAEKYKDTHKIIYGKQDGKGKWNAVQKGFEMATGDILTIFDADMTVPAFEIPKFYNALRDNRADFINGCRLVYPMEKQSMQLLNFFANKIFGLTFSALLGTPLKDTLCGTKMFTTQNYQKIKKGRAFFGNFDPFGDFDMLFGASKLNFKIVDIPVHYKERIYGTTNISRFKHGIILIKMVIFAAKKIKFI
jgi:hypothetical protein